MNIRILHVRILPPGTGERTIIDRTRYDAAGGCPPGGNGAS